MIVMPLLAAQVVVGEGVVACHEDGDGNVRRPGVRAAAEQAHRDEPRLAEDVIRGDEHLLVPAFIAQPQGSDGIEPAVVLVSVRVADVPQLPAAPFAFKHRSISVVVRCLDGLADDFLFAGFGASLRDERPPCTRQVRRGRVVEDGERLS